MPVLLLAVLGIGFPLLPRVPAALSSTPKKEPAGAGELSEGAAAAPTTARSEEPRSCEEQFQQPAKDLVMPVRRSIIVTVADPADSMSDYHLDRQIDAIQRAAFDASYIPDRFYLPWKPRRPSGGKSAQDSKDDRCCKSGTEPPKKEEHCEQKTPGRLLFRHSARSELLQVLLVGEVATWGVHRGALRRAVAEVLSHQPIDQDRQIRIVGPTFSGSAQSLHDVLSESCQPASRTRCHVVNGSATSPRTAAVILGGQPYITYEATLLDDEQMLKRFTRYLVAQGMATHTVRDRRDGTYECYVQDVAVLRESGTTYGGDFRDLFKRHQPPADAVFKPVVVSSVPDCGVRTNANDPSNGLQGNRCRHPKPPGECSEYLPQLSVEYASHVAQMRTQHEQQPHKRSSSSDDQRLPLRTIPLSLDQEQDASEVLPTFSPRTAVSEELMLRSTLSEMCRQEIRYVGIVGTQTLDRMFLAQQIKEVCPNVRLFFFESDILFIHPEYNSLLQGSLVLSSYPLLLQNRAWSWPFDSAILSQFAALSQIGTYNAILRQISDEAAREMREHLPPFRMPPRDPPLLQSDAQAGWLTVIGDESFWPLATLPRRSTPPPAVRLDCPAPGAAAKPPAGSPPDSADQTPANGWELMAGHDARWIFNRTSQWRALMVLLSVLCGGMAVGYWLRRFRRPERPLPPGLRWCDGFVGWTAEPPAPGATLFQLLIVGSFAAVYLVASLTWFIEAAGSAKFGLRCLIKLGQLAQLWQILSGLLQQQSYKVFAEGLAMVLISVLLSLASLDVVLTQLGRRLAPSLPRKLRGPGVEVAILGSGVLIFLLALRKWNGQPGTDPFAWLGWLYAWLHHQPTPARDAAEATIHAILFRERTGNIDSGVSILMTTMPFSAALVLCGVYGLRRVVPPADFPRFPAADGGLLAGVEPLTRRVVDGVRPFGWNWSLVLLAIVTGMAWLPYRSGLVGLEGPAWDLWAKLAAFLIVLCAIEAGLGFFTNWRQLRALLVRYSCLPLGRAFGQLPVRFSQQLGGLMLARPPHPTELAVALGQLRQLAQALEARPGADWAGLSDAVGRQTLAEAAAKLGEIVADPVFASELERLAGQRTDATITRSWQRLREGAELVLTLLDKSWQANLDVASPGKKDGAPDEAGRGERIADCQSWLRLAEVYVATLLACLIFRLMASLRYRLTAATGSLLLLLSAIMSYPFLRQHTLVLATDVGMAIVAALAVAVFVEMEKNETLSRVHGTDPGKVTWNRTFVIKLTVFVLVPLFGAVAADVPAMGRALFGWVLPVFQLLQ